MPRSKSEAPEQSSGFLAVLPREVVNAFGGGEASESDTPVTKGLRHQRHVRSPRELHSAGWLPNVVRITDSVYNPGRYRGADFTKP